MPRFTALVRPGTASVGGKVFAISTGADIGFAFVGLLDMGVNVMLAGVIQRVLFAVKA